MEGPSEDVVEVLDELNELRQNPSSLKKKFETVSKALARVKKTKESKELAALAADLPDMPKMNTLIFSKGLMQAAKQELQHIVKSGSVHHLKMSRDDLTEHVSEFVDRHSGLFEILDHGDIDQMIPRSMISDHDPKRTYRKAIFTPGYKYVGIATQTINDEQTTIIILAEMIKEKVVRKKLNIDMKDYDEIKQAFDLFDINHIGRIDPKETKKAMQQLGFEVKHPIIYETIHKLDIPENQESGGVDWDDFLYNIVMTFGDDKSKDGLYRIFQLYLDHPNDPRISLSSLKKICSDLGEKTSLDEVKELIKIATVNGNYITFDEFYQVLSTAEEEK